MQHLIHRAPGLDDPVRRDTLPQKVLPCNGTVGKIDISNMVHNSPVYLLGHPLIKAAVPRLHVKNRNLPAFCRYRGETAVGVAKDQQCVWSVLCKNRIHPGNDLSDGLCRSGPRCLQKDVWRPQLQVFEEDLVKFIIIVLPGVNKDMLHRRLCIQPRDHAGKTDDLRPGANHGHYLKLLHRCHFVRCHGSWTGRGYVSGFSLLKSSLDQKRVIRSDCPTFSIECV